MHQRRAAASHRPLTDQHCDQHGSVNFTLTLAGGGGNPHLGRAFSIARPGRGVDATPFWRFKTKRRSASRKITIDCSRRVIAIGGIFFDPRLTFDLVMKGQKSIFGEIAVSST